MKKVTALKAAREQSGKTQLQVANEVSINIRLYQKHENEEVIPNAKVGNRIARGLGTTSEKLWGY